MRVTRTIQLGHSFVSVTRFSKQDLWNMCWHLVTAHGCVSSIRSPQTMPTSCDAGGGFLNSSGVCPTGQFRKLRNK